MAARQPLILLTGATGFVGRQLLRALIERTCNVRVVLRDGKRSQFAGSPTIESLISSPDIFAESAAWWADAEAFVCGPAALMAAVRALYADRGLESHVHSE